MEFREFHREGGINLFAGLVLVALLQAEWTSFRALRDELSRPRTTISSALQRLGRLGYVQWRRRERDRRRIDFGLTRVGTRMAWLVDTVLRSTENEVTELVGEQRPAVASFARGVLAVAVPDPEVEDWREHREWVEENLYEPARHAEIWIRHNQALIARHLVARAPPPDPP